MGRMDGECSSSYSNAWKLAEAPSKVCVEPDAHSISCDNSGLCWRNNHYALEENALLLSFTLSLFGDNWFCVPVLFSFPFPARYNSWFSS